MAPEHPPSLVIFDTIIQENELVGNVTYIEAPPGEHLRIRWNVSSQPTDFRPIGNGVAYVYTKNTQVTEVPTSSDAKADNLGNFRYRWSEGLQFGIPWLMFILILPENYTLLNSKPLSRGVKNFGKKIALYWLLEGDKFNRTRVEWQIGTYKGDIDSEVIRLNNISVVDDATDIFVGDIDKSQEEELLRLYSRRLQKLKEKEAILGISVDPSVLIEIEDIEEKIEKLKGKLGSK